MEDLETSWGEVAIMVVVLAVAAAVVAVIAEVTICKSIVIPFTGIFSRFVQYALLVTPVYHNMVH